MKREKARRLEFIWQIYHIYIIFMILLISFILRLILAFNQNSVWYDQALYCHEAQNILKLQWNYINTNDNNFYTLQQSGLDSYNQPLYPILIALLFFLFKDIELSGTIISLLSNLLMIYFIYIICNKFMNKSWSVCVLIILSFHMDLIEISISKYAESLYLLFLALAVYTLFMCFESKDKLIYPLLNGITIGLAYLTKPEAFVLFPFFAMLICFKVRKNVSCSCQNNCSILKRYLYPILVFLAALFIIVTPYTIYLKTVTGSWQISQKNIYSLIVAERMETMSYEKAYWELNEKKTDTILSERVSRESFWSLMGDNTSHLIFRSLLNSYKIFKELFPFLDKSKTLFFALIILAPFFLVNKGDKRKGIQICIILFLMLQITPYSIMIFLYRPLITLIPVMTILSIYSLSIISHYFSKIIQIEENKIVTFSSVSISVLVMIFCFSHYGNSIDYVRSFFYVKDVGNWLSYKTEKDAVIMSRDPEIPYYAQRNHIIYPYGHQNEIYHYAKIKGARYIVDQQEDKLSNSYNFSLVKEFSFPHQKIYIYRLKDLESTSYILKNGTSLV